MAALTGKNDTGETLAWLHPQLVTVLLAPDLRENQEQIKTWPFGSRESAMVRGIITEENGLTEHGKAVIEALSAEELVFAEMRTTMSGEALTWLLDPDVRMVSEHVTTLDPTVRLDLVVNDILDADSYTGTPLGQRFRWFLERNSTS